MGLRALNTDEVYSAHCGIKTGLSHLKPNAVSPLLSQVHSVYVELVGRLCFGSREGVLQSRNLGSSCNVTW